MVFEIPENTSCFWIWYIIMLKGASDGFRHFSECCNCLRFLNKKSGNIITFRKKNHFPVKLDLWTDAVKLRIATRYVLKMIAHLRLNNFLFFFFILSTNIFKERKRKRSDSFLWQKPLYQQTHPKSNVTTQSEVRWIGCLTSQLTIFQSYVWRHIDVQADWRRSN